MKNDPKRVRELVKGDSHVASSTENKDLRKSSRMGRESIKLCGFIQWESVWYDPSLCNLFLWPFSLSPFLWPNLSFWKFLFRNGSLPNWNPRAYDLCSHCFIVLFLFFFFLLSNIFSIAVSDPILFLLIQKHINIPFNFNIAT